DPGLSTGAYPLTVIASGGGVTGSVSFTLRVVPPPSFTLAAGSSTVNVLAGGSATVQITATALNGFKSPVALSAPGPLPTGVTVRFAPASISTGSGKSTVTISASAGAAPGTVAIAFKGSNGDGSITAITTVSLTTGQFSASAQTATTNLSRGGSVSIPIDTTETAGLNAPIALTVSGLPSGITAAFAPAQVSTPGTASSALTLNASTGAMQGTRTITIRATAASVVQ